MQLLRKSTDPASPAACARAVLDGVPPLMQFIRHVAGARKVPGLSVQQFRALGFLRRRPGDSLSNLAEHLGLSLPTASRMIDALVSRGLVRREPIPQNRRQVQLTLTAAGSKSLEAAVQATLDELEQRLAALDDESRRRIVGAVRDLRRLFEPPLGQG
jgi:MarR family transcriptional regulator for hemolysin